MAKILLIEDEAELRTALRTMLELEGHEVIEAAHGRDGVSLNRSNPADVVITDILMPEMDGVETIIALRRDNPGLKIIAISAGGQIGSSNFLELAAKFGATCTLAKPFRREQLISAVRETLASAA